MKRMNILFFWNAKHILKVYIFVLTKLLSHIHNQLQWQKVSNDK